MEVGFVAYVHKCGCEGAEDYLCEEKELALWFNLATGGEYTRKNISMTCNQSRN